MQRSDDAVISLVNILLDSWWWPSIKWKLQEVTSEVWERERDRLQAIYLFVQPKFFLLLIFYINMLEKRSTKLHSHSTYDLNALQRTEIRLQKSKKKASWWARRMKENKKNNIHTKLDFFLLSVCFQCESFYWFALFTFPLSPLTRSTLWGMPSGFICSFVLQFCVFTFFRVFLFHSFCCVQLHFVQMDRHDWSEQVSEWSERKLRDFMLWLRFIPAGKYAHMFQLLSLTEFPL